MEGKNMFRKPMILFFAGPNGSGKSTVTPFFDKVGNYTNADDIVLSSGLSNLDAAKIVDESRYTSIKNKEDFTFETVLSSKYKIDILNKAKSECYFIKGIFVLTVDPQINISRVKTRIANGGHGVAKDKIVSRYYKSLDNIKVLMDICDILHIYDNTEEPVRIVRKHKDDISIFANKFWSIEDIENLIY